MKQKLFTFFLALVASASAIYASNTQVDGIWYDFDSSTKTATVTYQGSYHSSYEDEYSGSVVIPETVTYNGTTYSVTSIGNSAFKNCKSLTSVTIPTSVTSIGSSAFSFCFGLTSITIPNRVTSIGYDAFSNCSSLTSVVWNAEDCADMSAGDKFPFGEKNSQITSFTFGDKVQHIPSNLCYNMRNLTSITIPNSVTSIGSSAFESCSGLTSITIPNSVTSIENSTFSSCSGLTSVTIPNSVTDIGVWAFHSCSSLTSVTISNSVTYIGYNAFYNCSSLTSLTIGESVTYIGENAFSNCPSLTSVVWNAENCADLSGLYLESSDYPFYNSFQITSLTFGDKVRYIPRKMFMNQKNLTSITIPNSVTSIGDYAFSSCSGLTSITIPNSVTSIGDHAFSYCYGLTSITIPNSVTSIGDHAFSYCYGLTSITIPNSVTSIGSFAFNSCSSLTSIYWNAIKCSDCSSSSPFRINSPNISLYIGDEVEYIPPYLFYELGNVTSLTLPKTLKSIGSSAFEDCTIQGKIDYKGDLGDWCKIKSISSLMWYFKSEGTLYINNKEIKDNLILPNSVDSIPSSAFYNCTKISSVKIPKDVKYIGSSAFCNCTKISSVQIPKNVKYIGSSAFGNCEKLYDIYCYAQEPPAANETSFANYNVNLYVPCESLKDYQMNPVFGSFKYIQCLDEEEIVEETELPVVSLYDWLLMLNINAINEMGYYFSQSDVNWYRVVGEPDDIHTDFPSDDQLVVEGSYYLTLENSLKGTGNYYAVVDVHQEQDMSGDSFMRSEIISYSTAKQPAKLALLPGVVANGQPLQLIGLNPEETTNIYVYNATGQLINQVSSTGNTTLNLDAASLAGYYQVVVQSLSTTETLRYIVK